jgi:ferric-dicitrate binding protein FerR (iron transport regulator)
VQRGPQTLPVEGALRIEEDSVVQTPALVRSSLFLDRGAWVLMDEKTAVQVGEKRIEVRSGRVWIDARGGEEVEISAGQGKVLLNAKGAGLSVTQAGSDAQIYCAAGQVTWHVGTQGGRLESGLSLLLKNGEARETAQALWDDWT